MFNTLRDRATGFLTGLDDSIAAVFNAETGHQFPCCWCPAILGSDEARVAHVRECAPWGDATVYEPVR